MSARGLPVFDSDSHVYEPPAIWQQYLDPEYRVLARSAFYHHVDDAGAAAVVVNGKPAPPMNSNKLIRQAIWRPGLGPDDIGRLDPSRFHPINPGAWDAQARLKDMDALGIEGALLFPTLFAEYFPVVENPDVAHALARAYNDWVFEFCKAAPGRLFAAAVLPLQEPIFAIAEARRVAKLGFRAASLRPSFFQHRFLNHPVYDHLWTELQSLDVAAFIHPSSGSANPEWTSTGSFVERVAANLQIGHNVAEAVAPLMDDATALIAFAFCGHMEEYPRLKLAFAHGGASWLTLALEKAGIYLTLAGHIRDVSLEPEHVFFERPSVVTFDAWDDSLGRLHDLYQAVAAWGSRYPQHDTCTPHEAIEMLERCGTPSNVIAGLMGGNARRLLGIGEEAPVRGGW